jgi:hypothetical protein
MFVVLSVFALALTGVMAAQNRPCSDERSHQFDFWIGEWDVYDEGELAGSNSIQPILDGCVLLESWVGSGGSKGSSFNFFNPGNQKWQQFWVWKNGATLELSGRFTGNRMVLEGKSKRKDGGEIFNRITRFKNDDAAVRQHWETSADQGKKWETAFDGLYKRRN